MLSGLPKTNDPRVIVDYSTGDDAGVYRLDGDLLLVQTVDFFTPIVDDPEAYGAIAAANALSDVYAMGGRPLCALSVAAFPEKDFPDEVKAAIVRGGAGKLIEANCALLGGHTIRDPEVKFGYAVSGLVAADTLMTNAAGKPGEVMILTKPLGTGIIATALKAGRASETSVEAATAAMARLNRIASAVATRHGVRCATDVTGFGLLGHAWSIARESRVSLRFEAAAVPLLPGAFELAATSQSAGLGSNRAAFSPRIRFERAVDPSLEALLHDPQTSGGLLLLAPPDHAGAILAELPEARVVGRAEEAGTTPLVVA